MPAPRLPSHKIMFFMLPNETICLTRLWYFFWSDYMLSFVILLRNIPQCPPRLPPFPLPKLSCSCYRNRLSGQTRLWHVLPAHVFAELENIGLSSLLFTPAAFHCYMYMYIYIYIYLFFFFVVYIYMLTCIKMQLVFDAS